MATLLGNFNLFESQNQFNKVLDDAMKGRDRIAEGVIQEAITSDLFAPFFNTAVKPAFETTYTDLQAGQIWRKIATVETLNNFLPSEYQSLEASDTAQLIDNGGFVTPPGTLPRVPELTPYPTFSYSGSGTFIEVGKNGARLQFSFEAIRNDQWDLVSRLPKDAGTLTANTEDVTVLLQLFSGNGLRADVFNDQLGTTLQPMTLDSVLSGPVVKNSPLTRDALLAATIQAESQKRGNTTVSVSNGWYLIVPPSMRHQANSIVSPREIEITRGNVKSTEVNVLNGTVEVLSTRWAASLGSNTAWVIVPKGGQTDDRKTLVKTELRGETGPELRVANNTGLYTANGAVPWTEGSFDNDDAQTRVRLITGSGLLNLDGIVGSTGLGA